MRLNNEKGMVLLVTLVMIALMSVIAISAIRGSNLQEAMAGNYHDRSVAFQSAEAGLRLAEKFITVNGKTAVFNGTNGLYEDQNLPAATVGNVKKWTASQWQSNSKSLTSSDIDLKLPVYPQYVIERITSEAAVSPTSSSVEFGDDEEIGTTSTYYRITSRGFGVTGTSEVILQSTFKASI